VGHTAVARNEQLWWSGGQSSRSLEAEDRFEGLAEASFLTFAGRVVFLSNFKFNVLREDYATKERRRRFQDDVNDVTALENWRPATPLTTQLTLPASHDHSSMTSRRHVTNRK